MNPVRNQGTITIKYKWYSLFPERKCPDCSGVISISDLTRRTQVCDRVAGCENCGGVYQLAGSRRGHMLNSLMICAPITFVILFITGGLIETLLPALTYEDAGRTKLRGAAFPIFALVFYACGLFYYRWLPLIKV
ncbi:MAG: hypothetical protein WA790_04945 [Sulfitobacter sp.]